MSDVVTSHATSGLLDERSSAVMSGDGLYRYRLDREWFGGEGRVVWVMLNPSTADHEHDDATMRRVRVFSQREGFGALTVVNLYAYRASDPHLLFQRSVTDPVGPHNDAVIRSATKRSDLIVVAWGHQAKEGRKRVRRVVDLLGDEHLFCLDTTMYGHPRHPLYVAGDQPLLAWDFA